MLADLQQRSISGQFFDDFQTFDASRYTLTKGVGGAVSVSAAAGSAHGGWLLLPTAAAPNDYQSVSLVNPVIEFLGNPKLPVRAECKIRITESAANSSSWYFGLTDTLAAGFLAPTGLSPAGYHGAVIFKPRGSAVIQFDTSNGPAKSSLPNCGAFKNGVAVLLSIVFDPADGVTGLLRPEVDGQSDFNLVPLRPPPIALAGMVPMFLSFGIVASTAAAEQVAIDYMGVDFSRLNT